MMLALILIKTVLEITFRPLNGACMISIFANSHCMLPAVLMRFPGDHDLFFLAPMSSFQTKCFIHIYCRWCG